ncbi:MAG: DHA2 family efflux MFS transporter permease subunit [Sneathiellales bacterium]|nr:DHA2 family efflux MFS transporter permease subunit [Sneathiellales bacterium]
MASARNIALQERFGPSYKWLAGFAVVLGLLTTILSSTMINVALTDIMAEFSITQASAQWMATAFLCACSVSMLTTSWLMKVGGARTAFIAASALFCLGSLLGYIAPLFEWLIAARVLQGIGAGILQPLSMSLVFILFPPEMRGRAMGLFGMGVVTGPAVGPVVGGIITDHLDWSMTFLAVVPLTLISAFLGWILLPNKQDEEAAEKLNVISLALIILATSCLLIGLSESQFHDLASVQVLPFLLISLLAFCLFITRDIKSPSPLVKLSMFRNPLLVASAAIGVFTTSGLFSTVYSLPLFTRTVQEATATDAGLILFPAGIALVFIFPIVGRLVDAMPAFILILVGQVLFIVSVVAISYADQTTAYWPLALLVLASRIGLGAIMPSNSTFALSTVSPEMVTQASGAINFVRMIGGTIAVNLTALLITAKTENYIPSGAAPTPELLTPVFQDVFLITAILFCFALVPSLYIASTYKGRWAQKSPAE